MLQMNSYYQQYYRQQQQQVDKQQQQQIDKQQQQQLNISNDDLYQLSLYIQNDPKIEQKYDSKIFIQCSSKLTKNISHQ